MSDSVAWLHFKTELIRHVGEKRPQSIFCEHTGYTPSLVSYWRRRDQVPTEAYDKIAGIPITDTDPIRFQGFHTKKFFDRVIELSCANTPVAKMSVMLSAEFHRKVTEGSVKSARHRMKSQIPGYRTKGA